MNTTGILSAIDGEISRLTQARSLLSGLDSANPIAPSTAPRRGRPKGSENKATSFKPTEFSAPKRRTLSAAGKARIAAAQRERWARQHATREGTQAPMNSSASKTARVTSPAKTSAKVSPAAKVPAPSKQPGTNALVAKRPNQVMKRPTKPNPPSKSATAVKRLPSKVGTRHSAIAKKSASKKSTIKAGTRGKAPQRKAQPSLGIPNRDADGCSCGFRSRSGVAGEVMSRPSQCG